jgi:hypothetical protein
MAQSSAIDTTQPIVSNVWSNGSAAMTLVHDLPDFYRGENDPRADYLDRLRAQTRVYSEPAEALPSAFVANWTRLGRSKISTRLYVRLSTMARLPIGWGGAASLPLSSGSLRNFLDFWKLVREHAVEPDAALAPSGRLQVEWYRSERRHADLEFGEDARVFFGLFDGPYVQEGVDSAANLAKLLLTRSGAPLRWHGE